MALSSFERPFVSDGSAPKPCQVVRALLVHSMLIMQHVKPLRPATPPEHVNKSPKS